MDTSYVDSFVGDEKGMELQNEEEMEVKPLTDEYQMESGVVKSDCSTLRDEHYGFGHTNGNVKDISELDNTNKYEGYFLEGLENGDEPERNPLWTQILLAIGPNLLILCGGMVAGYSAIMLPQLNDTNSVLKITKTEQIWIASVPPFAMAIGCVASGWSLEAIGRLKTNITATVIMIIGWAIIYFGDRAITLISGRLISGFSLGYFSPACVVYVAEISHPRYRGLLLAATPLFISLGLLLVHFLGSVYSWRFTALVATFVPLCCLVCFAFSRESHVWYANRGDFHKAAKTFFWFRGDNHEAREELSKMLKGKQVEQPKRSLRELYSECCRANFIKPFLIMCLFFATMQVSGNNAIVFYSVSIMQSTVPGLNNYAAMLIVDAMRVVMAVVGCIATKKFKVRPLTMISGFGTVSSLFFLSISVIIANHNPDNTILSIIPIFGLISYTVFMSLGLMTLPWALCGELFPPSTKGVGGGISSCFNFLVFFMVVKTSPGMFEVLGSSTTFALYGLSVLICTTVLYYVLPETKNKTLKDIEAFFNKKTILQ